MSFHGGFLGGTFAIFILSKVQQKHFFELSDRIVSGLPI